MSGGRIIRPDQTLQPGQSDALVGGGVYGTPSATNPYVTREYLTHPQHLEVCHSNKGDFTSIREAVLSITDASITKPYVVSVHPGIWDEDPFTIPAFVSIIAIGGYYNTLLRTTDNNNHFITGNQAAELVGLGILGPTGTGYAAVYHELNSTYPFKMVSCVFRGGYYGLWAHLPGVTGRSRVHLIHCGNMYTAGYVVQKMIYGTGRSNIVVLDSAIMSGSNGHVLAGYCINGADTEMIVDNSVFYMRKGSGGDTLGVEVVDGEFRGKSMTINSCTTGARVSGTGQAHFSGCEMTDDVTGNHIEIVDATSVVVYGGKMNKTKISNPNGGTFVGSFSDETVGEEGQVVLGELWLGTQESSIPMRAYGLAAYDTGWVSGGQVTIGPGTRELLVEAGTGYINTGTAVKPVSWGATAVYPAAGERGYVYVDASGVVQFSVAEPSYETVILLAAAGADATKIVGVAEHRIPIKQITPRLEEYIEEVIGPICGHGLIVTQNTDPGLDLAVDAGAYFRGNAEHTIVGGAPITFTRLYRNGSGGWNFVANQTTIDADYWDDGSGTLAAVPAGQYSRDLLYVNKTPFGEMYYYIYAQETYASQMLAETGNNPITIDFMRKYGLQLAAIVSQQGSTDITSIVDQRPFLGQFASGSTAVTDHGGLSGLADDDHTQYFNQTRGDARYALDSDFDAHTGATVAHGAQGAVVGTTNTQTLQNKTLTGTDMIGMDVTAGEPAYALGQIYWDAANETLAIQTSPDTTIQVGQETVALCYNADSVPIVNGQAVRLFGAQGDRPSIKLAKADAELTQYAFGLATQDIAVGAVGFATLRGVVHGIDTRGYLEGQLLWLSPDTAGALTGTRPDPPAHACSLGRALNSKNNGSIYVSATIGYEIDELHDVLIGTKADNDLIVYEQSSGLWKNKQLPSHTHAGYEPANANIQTHISSTSNPHSTTAGQVGADPVGTAASAVSSHEGSYAHGDIAHTNRTALNNVSGVNTGDQDLSGYSPTSHTHSGVYEPANSNIQTHIGSTSNPHSTTAAQVGAAPAAEGVTNGNSHDHNGGDGAQISHANLSNVGTNTHAQLDTHLASTSNPHSTTGDQVLPSQSGQTGKFLTTNGANCSWGTPPGAGMTMLHKVNDQTKTNDAALASDTTLQFTLLANTKYMFRMVVFYDTTAAADFKWRHTGTGASTSLVRIKRKWIVPGGSAYAGILVDTAFSAADLAIATNAANGGYIEAEGIIVTTGTPGTFAFQWAQNTADAGNTIVRAGSYIEWMVVA